MKTRCKFYVTATKTTSGVRSTGKDEKGIEGWEPCLFTEVFFNAAYSSDKTSENYAFWKASPNGKLEISGPANEMAHFVPGSFWYIDEELIDELAWAKAHGYSEITEGSHNSILSDSRIWRLSLMEKPYGGQLRLQLRRCKGAGLFEISIDNESAWTNYTKLDDLYWMEILPAPK